MITPDPTWLARLRLRDDARQHTPARRLLEQRRHFTPPVTVVPDRVRALEVNGCGCDGTARGLMLRRVRFNFRPAHPATLRRALQGHRQGIDFAGALHRASSGARPQRAISDTALATRAGRLGSRPGVSALQIVPAALQVTHPEAGVAKAFTGTGSGMR